MITQSVTPNSEIEIKKDPKLMSLIGVGLIFVAMILFVFFVRPFHQAVAKVKEETILKTQELTALKTKVADFENAKTKLGVNSELQKLEMLRSIPIGVSQDKAIEDIVQLAKDHNIELSSIGFSKGITSKSKIGILQVSAGFDGTYEDLTEFLKALEQNKRMFRVNSISVQLMNTDTVGLKRAVFSLSMDTFYQE
jgi:Tfp pilus assembly protein PilO